MRATPIMLTTGLCFILAACNAPEPTTAQPSSATPTAVAPPAPATPPQPAPPAAISSASAAPTTEDADASGAQTRYFDCGGKSVAETISDGGSDAVVLVDGATYDMKRAGSGDSGKYADAKGNTLADKGSAGTTLTMSGEKDVNCKEELKKKG